MANGNITVEVRLPRETMETVLLIARTAGVSPASVIKVAMALQVLKFQQEQTAPPESANVPVERAALGPSARTGG